MMLCANQLVRETAGDNNEMPNYIGSGNEKKAKDRKAQVPLLTLEIVAYNRKALNSIHLITDEASNCSKNMHLLFKP